MNDKPALDQVLKGLLNLLKGVAFPEQEPPLPPSSLPDNKVSVIKIAERPLAIGGLRGVMQRGPLAEVLLKGGRLSGIVRFEAWGSTRDEVEKAVADVHGRLLGARELLRAEGFINIVCEYTSLPHYTSPFDAWSLTTDYSLLFEFHYEETEHAESIIARIPINVDLEERNSVNREITIVKDEITRWDDDGASALEVSGSSLSFFRVTGLATLAYLIPGWSGQQVTLARLRRGATEDPTDYSNLTDFHAAVTHKTDPDRHAQVTHDSVVEFLAAFSPTGEPIELGDGDLYQPGSLDFDPPIVLATGDDLMRLSYEDTAFDAKAVVYLRAGIHKS